MAALSRIEDMDYKAMRILIITNLYPPQFVGGYELRCKETAVELAQRGNDVFVLSSKWERGASFTEDNVYRRLLIDSSDEVPSSNIDNSWYWRQRYQQIQSALHSRRNYAITTELINTLQPSLVFVWNMGGMGVSPILASQDQGIPVVFSIGDYWLIHLKQKLCDESSLIKRKYWSAILGLGDFNRLDLAHLLVVSGTVRQVYVKNGFLEQNLHIIPRGVKSERVLPERALSSLPDHHQGQVKFLFLGRLVPEKGPDVAIGAIEILRREYGIKNIQLDIVGDGPSEYILMLKNLVSKWKLEDQVSFLGKLEHSQVWDLYMRYNALLFPYRWEEPIGGTILEAMARGLPVIISERGGPMEDVKHGENGLLVPGDRPEEWAEAINRFLALDTQALRNMRISALNTIKEKYIFESVVDRILAYFQQIAS